VSAETYSTVGAVVLWTLGACASLALLAFASVLFDSWILKPRREAIFKAGQHEAVGHILRNAYWFSEHPPTMNLLRNIVKVYSEGQGQPIDQIRNEWRREMEKP